MPVAVIDDISPEEDSPEAQFLYGTPGFLHRFVDVERRDHCDSKEAIGVERAEVVHPVVVSPGKRCREPGVQTVSREGMKPSSRIQGRDIDSFIVHSL